jgi:hypothetical protein
VKSAPSAWRCPAPAERGVEIALVLGSFSFLFVRGVLVVTRFLRLEMLELLAARESP